jgi:putative membrane protein (TIGR04086 family)
MSSEGASRAGPGEDPVEDGRISGLVVARGAATGLIIAMPAAFVNGLLADQTPKPKGSIAFTFMLVIVGFFVAGWLAGREAHTARAKHGALAALVAFLPVELVSVLGRLDRGTPVSVGQIIIVGLLAACAGTVGAQLAARQPPKRGPA